eukprot:TRINITY_DN15774_c0_g1_i1.p1 TRINITY_DN15774_c0_g1~~TRINITY_DN15774_c0_g1_i1.p1  ORF type:complete len:404 (+),score=61.62 TRINITY_DN15774_c0_g1_i1:32-1243(+)
MRAPTLSPKSKRTLVVLLAILIVVLTFSSLRKTNIFGLFTLTCENQGIAKSGYCECQDFYVGLRCETDMFYQTKHIPPSSELIELPHFVSQKSVLQNLLTTIHNPPDCSRALAQDFPPFGSSGIGSDLRMLVRPFSQAVRNKALVLPLEDWPWAYPKCRAHNYECYLQPFSRCNVSNVAKIIPFGRPLLAAPSNSDFYGMNSVWYRGNLLMFALKPHYSILQKMREAKKTLDFPPPRQIIALHIRGGDSCHVAERVCYRLKDYMKTVQRYRELYGVSTIYLSTDSEQAIIDTKNFPEFKFVYLDVDRKHYDVKVFVEDRREEGQLNQKYEVELSMTDIWLMSECGYFLGTFSSNFGRLAFELMVAKINYVPPYASLDIGWCTHWMHDEEIQLRRDIEASCEWV